MSKRKLTAKEPDDQRKIEEKPIPKIEKDMVLHKTISNLTDVVSKLQHDVTKIKVRLGV